MLKRFLDYQRTNRRVPRGAFAVAFALTLLEACASAQLPVAQCSAPAQEAYLANCKLALAVECERSGECLPPELCQVALAELCPAE